MSGILRLSTRAYGGVLLLYPADLRRDFGPEIRELFSEDLNDAWQSNGLTGVLRVWWCAFCEFLRIALPGMASNPAFAVPVVAFAFDAVVMSFQVAAVLSHHPLILASGLSFREEVLLRVLLPSTVTGFTALAAVHSGKVRVLSLNLNVTGETPCSKSVI